MLQYKVPSMQYATKTAKKQRPESNKMLSGRYSISGHYFSDSNFSILSVLERRKSISS